MNYRQLVAVDFLARCRYTSPAGPMCFLCEREFVCARESETNSTAQHSTTQRADEKTQSKAQCFCWVEIEYRSSRVCTCGVI
jgi:hypothetical protein